MKRRCAFLDTLPAFNYNIGKGETIKDDISGEEVTTDTRKLGSTLMRTMIEEASNFCDQNMKRNWTGKSYQQVEILANVVVLIAFFLFLPSVKHCS